MASLSIADIHRLHLADVTLPQGTPQEGQLCPVYGFVITHPDGVVVFDTGVGEGKQGIEALYKPRRQPLAGHLSQLAIAPTDVALVVNSHLHLDNAAILQAEGKHVDALRRRGLRTT